MDRPSLRYSDLSVDTIKQLHRESGGVLVELSPRRGRMLNSLLEQRDRVEGDLYTDANLLRLLWDYCVWSFYEIKARLFHKRLLVLQRYVSAVDAAHGWETTSNGSQLFVLLPINKERPNPALQRDAPTSGTPLS